MRISRSGPNHLHLFWLAAALILFAAAPNYAAADGSGHLTADKTGQFSTRAGLELRVNADQGDIHVSTHDSPSVSYHVHLETEANDSTAQRILDSFTLRAINTPDGVFLAGHSPHLRWGQHLRVSYDLVIPRRYNVDLSTNGGSVQLGDLQGRATIASDGGNISTGEIDSNAKLMTGGGHISVKNVSGDLVATTGAGNITAGDISGTAVIRSGGGHIRIGTVGGQARIETGGGNIFLERSGGMLTALTGGGDIEVGEAAGLVRARTGGGGIRVVRASGPTELDTGSGNVYLMQLQNAVRASTGAGGITAWFGPDAKLTSPCRLEAGEGDITVYLPRQLAVRVDAQVEYGGAHRVIVDPAFPLKVTYGEPDEGSQAVRAEGALNGGGAPLIIRTVSGNIRLILNDEQREQKQLQLLKQQMERLKRQLQNWPGLNPPPPPPPSEPDQNPDSNPS